MISELNSKGLLALQLGNYDEAEECFARCLDLDSQSPQLHYNLALTWYRQGEIDKARIKFNTVINFDRSFADAWAMIGEIAKQDRKYSDASYAWLQALIYEQNLAKKRELRTLRAFNELIQGRIEEGYSVLEKAVGGERTDPPHWTRDVSLQGKRLLVIGDQGLGDQIFYARWIPWLESLGAGRVAILVEDALHGLFKREWYQSGTLTILPKGVEHYPCDYQIKLSELPVLFQTTLGTIPAHPYLEYLSGPFAEGVGLCWSGNPLHRNDKERSIPLKEFAPLFEKDISEQVAIFSLQQDVRASDKEFWDKWFADDAIDSQDFEDMADTAEAINELDLVISCDTSVANLAGAMGKETWVLVPYSPDWRWMADGDSTIWYPSVKVYRQGEDRKWGPVIERVKHDLLERLNG